MRHGKYPWKQRQSSYGSRQEAILRVAVNAIVAIILLLPRVSLTLAAYESPRILGPELQFDLVEAIHVALIIGYVIDDSVDAFVRQADF